MFIMCKHIFDIGNVKIGNFILDLKVKVASMSNLLPLVTCISNLGNEQ